MQNTNLSSMLSTAELRELERQYATPKTPIQGLILKGIQAQMQENVLPRSLADIIEEKDEAIATLEEENQDLESKLQTMESEAAKK